MGRLIDTDVLEEFIKTHSCSVGTDGVLLTVGEDNTWHNLLEYIPTAHDVDKVVEQLEKLRSKDVCEYLDCDVCLYRDKCGAETDQSNNLKWDKAVEIVKQGVIHDDVCEWKTASDGEFIQNPHTKRLYSNESSMKNIYCNTCGKKIKVVDNGKQCSNRNSNGKRDSKGHYDRFVQMEAKEHEQIVEWLEELKAYRASIFSGDMTQAMLKEERNKAIDDFVKLVKEHQYLLSDVINSKDYGIFTVGIEQIAEQLKVGGENVD